MADSIGGDEWKHMGRELCLDESKMENIGSEQRKQEERGHQVLLSWQRSVGKDATVKILETTLVKIKRKDVAEKLVKHQSEH